MNTPLSEHTLWRSFVHADFRQVVRTKLQNKRDNLVVSQLETDGCGSGLARDGCAQSRASPLPPKPSNQVSSGILIDVNYLSTTGAMTFSEVK